ncbi:MAG: hypothetical protein FJ390_07290 [Verrucomicrobia bacterium]|nr:hypothetical protein [Verrucomicrobiota bacterium]
MKTSEEIQNAVHKSRRNIGFHYTALSEEVNVSMRLRNSIRRQPWRWMGGALAAGIVAGFFNKGRSVAYHEKESPSSKKNSSLIKHAGTVSSLLLGETTLALAVGKFFSILFPLLRPIITEYVTRKFSSAEKEDHVIDIRP